MLTEAEQIAVMLEQIGRRALACCEELPEESLHWPPPLPATPSLFTLATLIIKEIDTWVLIPIGGKVAADTQEVQIPSSSTYSKLSMQYKDWVENVQKLLSILPNSFLDLYVENDALQRDDLKTHGTRLTIRACVLTALEQSAILLGRMQGLRELLCDGERLLQEVENRAQELS